MIPPISQLQTGKKVYFASDFHLGVPDAASSLVRERKIVRWLESIRHDAQMLFLVGDIFDFWFEYRHAIPKGFIRLQGKLAELSDSGLPIYFFTGNHDMWMFEYFTKELNIEIVRHPVSIQINTHTFHIGHGDGLGPKDYVYKALKKVFRSGVSQWLFARIHPNLGIGLANYWSRKSRIQNTKADEIFKPGKEWLIFYCQDMEKHRHHDYYIFGHRHLPLDIPINENSRYLNLGEWVNYCTYAEYDGNTVLLNKFEA